LAPGWWPDASFDLQDSAAFGQLLAARFHLFFMLLTVMRNRVTQTLLLGITLFTAQLASSLSAISSSFI
jgi:hypothetical protein